MTTAELAKPKRVYLNWTPELDAEIARYARLGLSSTRAAEAMSKQFDASITKFMVLKRGRRLGVTFTGIGGPAPAGRRGAPGPKKPRERVIRIAALANEPPPAPGTITLCDAGLFRCKWPLWPDGIKAPPMGQQFVCGAPTVGTGSWCGEHANRCASRAQEPTRAVHREFRKFSTITGAVA
jgi:hypothetical protein